MAGCGGQPAVHDYDDARTRGHLGDGALRGGLERWRLVGGELLPETSAVAGSGGSRVEQKSPRQSGGSPLMAAGSPGTMVVHKIFR